MATEGQAPVIAADLPVRRRVRSGCFRCRKSHMKCDEQKPSCLRCSRNGIRCQYPPPKQDHGRPARPPPRRILPSASAASASAVATAVAAAVALAPPSPSPGVPVSPLPLLGPGAVLYYDRFRNQIASEMGSQVEGPSDFWLRSVLRESSRDDCILDSVIALGALAYAQDQASSPSSPPSSSSSSSSSPSSPPQPLFLARLSSSSGGGLDGHYREAIRHYTLALGKLRRRIASPSAAPLSRTILINTVLFSFFEAVQGDTASADKLMAHGILLLKDTMLRRSRRRDHPSLIAAAADDDGVLEAEWFLVRTATWNIMYSPMYPCQKASVLDISYERPHLLPLPLPAHSPHEFWTTFWHAVTMAAVWNARVQVEIAGRAEAPFMTDPWRQEHDTLLSRLESWEAAALERMRRDRGPMGWRHPVQVFGGARVLRTLLRCGVDPTGAAWDRSKDACLEVLYYYHRTVAGNGPAYARAVIYDAILAGVSQLALSARDHEVRFGAMDLWKRLVHRQSSWDIKSVFMGVSALIAVEEGHRDQHGYIPLGSRYDWTRGAWNDAYTEFHVTLTPKGAGAGDGSPNLVGEKNLTLRPADYEFD